MSVKGKIEAQCFLKTATTEKIMAEMAIIWTRLICFPKTKKEQNAG